MEIKGPMHDKDIIKRKLEELRAVIDGVGLDADPAEVLDRADSVLKNPDWVQELSRSMLTEFGEPSGEAALFRGLFRDGGADALSPFGVLEHPNLRVVLQSVDAALLNAARAAEAGPETMVFSGQAAAIRAFGSGRVVVEVYRTEPFGDGTDFPAPRRSWREEPVTLTGDGPMLHIGLNDGFRLVSAEGAPLLMLTTTPIGAVDVTLHVSARTGATTKIVPNSARHSPLPFHLAALTLLEHPKAAEVAAKMARHKVFFVRWDAMRELAKLTGAEALPVLAEFKAAETNPMVMRAAVAMRSVLSEAA